MNIGESLPRNARRFPKKIAICDHVKSLTYLDLHLRTNQLGNYLMSHDVRPGDLVAFSCGSRSENFELLFALGKIGAIAVPFDFHWTSQECRSMIEFLEPKAFVVEGREETRHLSAVLPDRFPPSRILAIDWPQAGWGHTYEGAIHSASSSNPPVDVKGLDPFLIMITSGTTGFPKACLVNHETYVIRSLNNAIIRSMNHETRALLTLPLHFNAGRGSMVGALYLGATVFIHERFNEEQFLTTVEAEKISYTLLVPTLCQRLLRHPRLEKSNTSSLQFIGITGGHLSSEEASFMMSSVCSEIHESYASTDCGQVTALTPEDRGGYGDTVGRPIWCVLLGILDDEGKEVSSGHLGEICARSPLCIQGYYRNAEATREFFAGGWCHSGDIGFLDKDGYLHVTGRKKNMIKSGGISIFPEEIEEVLSYHPKVLEAAVVGFKSDAWGEAVKAFVVLKPGESTSADELIRYCKEAVASYKAPKAVVFVDALPRTGLGKIDRGKLIALTDEVKTLV
jgi:acyl-CoA synthetase (AMP-forming)/AMP-acid ligase II